MRPGLDLFKRTRQASGRTARQEQAGRPPARVGGLEWVLEAGDDEEYQVRFQSFCTETLEPLVDRCVARQLGISLGTVRRGPERPEESDAVEIRSKTIVKVLAKLDETRRERTKVESRHVLPIQDLEAYILKAVCSQRAEITRTNAWRTYCRQVRRVVDQHPVLKWWDGVDGRGLVGRAVWRDCGVPPVTLPDPEVFLSAYQPRLDAVRSHSYVEATVIIEIVDCVQAPLLVHDMLRLLAVYYQVADRRRAPLRDSDSPPEGLEGVRADPAHAVDATVLGVEIIDRVWCAIQRMPPGWRHAALLGIDDLLALIVGYWVATLGSVAASIDLSEAELEELCPRIALRAEELARRLRIATGTVRNHRMYAREALRELWKKWDDV